MLSGGLTWWFSHDPHEPKYICFVFVPVQFAGDQSVHRRSPHNGRWSGCQRATTTYGVLLQTTEAFDRHVHAFPSGPVSVTTTTIAELCMNFWEAGSDSVPEMMTIVSDHPFEMSG